MRDFICYAHGVKLPDVQVCPNHTTPWRAFADAYFAKSSTAVWKASRGFGGKTFILGLLSLVEAETLKATVSLLGGSGEQSERVLDDDHIGKFLAYESAPRHLLKSDIAREMTFISGNRIEALMASQRSVRGPHPQRLRLDEIDEMDLKILDAATGQPMSGDSGIPIQTVMSSTHQNADGTMTEILKRAASKGWPLYEWCYRESMEPHGWLSQKEVTTKFNDITDAVKKTEYDLQEPSPESRAIDPMSVEAMFKHELGEFEGEPRQYVEIESPQEDEDYVTGADWAKQLHWTIIYTFRLGEVNVLDDGKREVIRPHRLVAFERIGREKWPAMIGRYEDRLKRFHSTGMHDSTGIGDVIEDEIVVTGSEGFDFRASRERANMLSDYCAAIEHGEIEAPYIRYMEQEHKHASWDDVYGSGHLPDTISAGALAYRAAHHGRLQVYL